MSKIKDSKSVIIVATQCPTCLDVIFSRDTHDYRKCSCEASSIDGGRDYTRLSFHDKAPNTFKLTLVGISLADLVMDHTLKRNKFGLTKTVKTVYDTLYNYFLSARGRLSRSEKK